MHGAYAALIEDMAVKARKSMDNRAFSLFRNSFTTTLTNDGSAWFSATHPLIGGGTTSNILVSNSVTNPALSTDSINDAITGLAEQVDQAGVVMGNTPRYLVVPLRMWNLAKRISESELYQGTANNDVNVYRSFLGFDLYTSPYLGATAGGSDTAWYMLSENHGIRRLLRQGLETRLVSWEYSNNRSYKYTANFREEYFVEGYVGSIGSTGLLS